jgi:hypothetical protein
MAREAPQGGRHACFRHSSVCLRYAAVIAATHSVGSSNRASDRRERRKFPTCGPGREVSTPAPLSSPYPAQTTSSVAFCRSLGGIASKR